MILTLALNYGGRAEIVTACRRLLEKVTSKKLNIDDIDESTFSHQLYTKNLPDPELLIRTSGESRLSNFLLWQISYAEFVITKVLWPDFKASDIDKAIEEYSRRKRRFGTSA